jgi:hypothetical protein
MANRYQRLAALVLSTTICVSSVSAIDNAHFYKPPQWQGQAPFCWFECRQKAATRDWASRFDASLVYGSTDTGWNKNGKTANILNSTGPANLLYLLENVQHDPTNAFNAVAAAQNLVNGRGMGTFGQVAFTGKFSMYELDFAYRQNLVKGFFFDCALPVRQLRIYKIGYNDLSPATGNGGFNRSTVAWAQLQGKLNPLLAVHGIEPWDKRFLKTGIGDLSLLLGCEKAVKVNSNCWLSGFLKAGAVLPTGDERSTKHIFALPLGNDKNVGITGAWQLSAGAMSWLALGVHGDVTYFVKGSQKDFRMKTADAQNGFLKLGIGKATLQNGVLWHMGADLSFDHVAGLSLRAGYSFTQQEEAKLTPANITLFSEPIVNNDPALKAWNLHTLHFMMDVDCSEFVEASFWAPRVSAFYNIPILGENAYKTQTYGGGLGMDVRWKF